MSMKEESNLGPERISEAVPVLGPERIIYSPLQVLSPNEIRVGETYTEKNRHDQELARIKGRNYDGIIRFVLGLPEIGEDGTLWVKVVTHYESFQFAEELSLEDLAVVPSPEGEWNQWNWLERVEDPKDTTTGSSE